MTFDLGEFYDTCLSIEHRLGILRANEAVREWWHSYQAELGPHYPRSPFVLGYQSTPAEVDYWVDFYYAGMPEFEGDLDAQGPQAAQVQAVAEQAWNNGRGWASGIGGYLIDMCSPFTRPQASYLREAADDFSSVRTLLQGVVPANWTELNVDDWQGEAHNEFQAFIAQLFDSMQQYELYLAHAENWFASASAFALQTQNGLLPFLREVDDQLDRQLKEWSVTQGSPQDRPGPNPKVADVLSIGRQVIAFIPPADKAVSTVEDVVGLTGDVLGLFGVEPDLSLPAPFAVSTAEEIYTGLTSTLYDKHLTPFNDSFTEMATRTQEVRSVIEGLGTRWYPPEVPGADAPAWEHSLE